MFRRFQDGARSCTWMRQDNDRIEPGLHGHRRLTTDIRTGLTPRQPGCRQHAARWRAGTGALRTHPGPGSPTRPTPRNLARSACAVTASNSSTLAVPGTPAPTLACRHAGIKVVAPMAASPRYVVPTGNCAGVTGAAEDVHAGWPGRPAPSLHALCSIGRLGRRVADELVRRPSQRAEGGVRVTSAAPTTVPGWAAGPFSSEGSARMEPAGGRWPLEPPGDRRPTAGVDLAKQRAQSSRLHWRPHGVPPLLCGDFCSHSRPPGPLTY